MNKPQSEVQASLTGKPVMMEAMAYRSALVSVQSVGSGMFFELAVNAGLHRVVGDVSIVKIVGSLYRSMFWDDYLDIRGAFDQAMANQQTRGILLEVDSPGGGVAGAFDLAEHIFRARGGKPIWAIAADQATSASYLIAAAGDRVIATPTAVVGSIGVIATHVDESGLNDRIGLKFNEIIAGAKKAELSPNAPLSDDGRATLQGIVDQAYDQFVSTVARYRGLAESAVRSQEAGVFTASQAKAHGLIDEVIAFDDAISRLQAEAPSTQASEAHAQLTALRQACFDVALEGRGEIRWTEAEELAAKIGTEAATTLIREHGGRVFFEVMSGRYWEAQ